MGKNENSMVGNRFTFPLVNFINRYFLCVGTILLNMKNLLQTWVLHLIIAVGRTYGLLRQLSPILMPSLFYGVEFFGHCDTHDMQILTVASNSIVRCGYNLHDTYFPFN